MPDDEQARNAAEIEDLARLLHRADASLGGLPFGGLPLLGRDGRSAFFQSWESLPERTRELYRKQARDSQKPRPT